jgi:hypothetical protein
MLTHVSTLIGSSSSYHFALRYRVFCLIWILFFSIWPYCDGIWPFDMQRLGKHCIRTGIIAEAEVILLGNGWLAPVSAATNVNKGIPVTTQKNRGTVRHGDFYSGRLAIIKRSSFANSSSERFVRDSSWRFFRHTSFKAEKHIGLLPCRTWLSRSDGCEEFCLLGYNAV